MGISELYVATVLGLTLSLLFQEKFGINPGGLVVPGYIALSFKDPKGVIVIFIISLLTYMIVEFVLNKFLILYGRRRFVATIVVAVILKLIFEAIYPLTPFPTFEFRGIGIIVPALLSNCYARQGIKLTVVSTLVMTAVVYGIMQIIYLV